MAVCRPSFGSSSSHGGVELRALPMLVDRQRFVGWSTQVFVAEWPANQRFMGRQKCVDWSRFYEVELPASQRLLGDNNFVGRRCLVERLEASGNHEGLGLGATTGCPFWSWKRCEV